MDLVTGQGVSELFQAQSELFRHMLSYMDSMSLRCAIQLGIPEIIHKHGQPITLPQLVTELHIPPRKTSSLHRLMRLLVHFGFFTKTKVRENQEEEEAYGLAPSSRFVLRDNVASFSWLFLLISEPFLVNPCHFWADWFRGSDEFTPFENAHGMGFWDYCDQHPDLGNMFNKAMASDSQLMSLVVKDYKPIFEGLGSLVDVGGGTGTAARIISEAFPQIKCTVFDLPRVVANLPDSTNLNMLVVICCSLSLLQMTF